MSDEGGREESFTDLVFSSEIELGNQEGCIHCTPSTWEVETGG
jgi:hypothetical protein